MSKSSPEEVAKFMLRRLGEEKILYQELIVYEIDQKFGKDAVYDNDNGNLAIDKKVLKAFRQITEKDVVWDRGERAWRFRDSQDGPSRAVEC